MNLGSLGTLSQAVEMPQDIQEAAAEYAQIRAELVKAELARQGPAAPGIQARYREMFQALDELNHAIQAHALGDAGVIR